MRVPGAGTAPVRPLGVLHRVLGDSLAARHVEVEDLAEVSCARLSRPLVCPGVTTGIATVVLKVKCLNMIGSKQEATNQLERLHET